MNDSVVVCFKDVIMNKLKLLFTALLLLCVIPAAAKDDADKLFEKRTVKLLCFGNSFSMDVLCYVPFVMKNIAPDVDLTVAIAYNGGSSLVQHMANFSNSDVVQNGVTYSPKKYKLYKCTNAKPWTLLGSYDANEALSNDDWDIVTFQNATGTVRKSYEIYYEPFINNLCDSVVNRLGDDIKLGWFSIHSSSYFTYDELVNFWADIVLNTKRLLDNTPVTVHFPYGTALQNLRTVRKYDNMGVSGFLMADTGHLQEGIGCLCAAYANCLVLLKEIGMTDVTVIGDTTRIDEEFLKYNQVQGQNIGDGIVGMDDESIYQAQLAATRAVENPFELTDINEETTVGKVLVERLSNFFYSINGGIVEKPSKGIYIHNGKKVLVK